MKIKEISQNIISILIKYCLEIISIIVGIIGIISIFITAYFNTTYNTATEVTSFKFGFGIIPILGICILVLILLFNKKFQKGYLKKISTKILLIIIPILLFIIYIFWISILKLEPIDDQKRIHEMAIDMINGKIGLYFVQPMYLFLYPYQLGIVFFVSIFYKVFGQNFIVFEYVNAICSILNFYLLYLISKEIFKEDISRYLIILLLGFGLYFMFWNVYFYGNIVGLTFGLSAILFTLKYLNNNKVHYIAISGVMIAISIILKSNYNIFLCGILVILILDLISNFNKNKMICLIIFLITYFMISIFYNITMEKFYDIKKPSGVPMINFIYMGMSDKVDLYPGWYNEETLNIYYRNNLDYEKSSKEARDLIKSRLKHFSKKPKEFLEYYAKKIGSTWLNPTFQTVWCSTPGARYEWDIEYAEYLNHHQKVLSIVTGNIYKIVEFYFDIFQVIVFIFAGIGIFNLAKKQELKIQYVLLPIIFLGGFLFHIIWETKAIYVLQYYYLLLPFSAYGIYYFSNLNFNITINKIKGLINNKAKI